MTSASLVIHQGAGAGDQHPVDGELILGREDSSADLVIPDPGVSRRHARVIGENGALILEDLGSSNGTYVNGERISGAVELAPGDEIRIGATVLGIEGTAATAVMPPGAPPTVDDGKAQGWNGGRLIQTLREFVQDPQPWLTCPFGA